LAATLIAVVMLLMIGNYYRQLEKEYLNTNGVGIADSLILMAKNDNRVNPDCSDFYNRLYHDEARITAFLIHARVQNMDSESGLLADSGTPTKAWYITLPDSSVDGVVNPDYQDSTTHPFKVYSRQICSKTETR
jgi:hypothetical protein